MDKIRIVCYINQFFGQIGGEEKADVGFSEVAGAVGPAVLVQNLVKDEGIVAATIICGDNYMSENLTEAAEEGLAIIEKYKPDLFIAGPAFNAGRYGVACAGIASAVSNKLKIPVVTGMSIENPGVDLCRKDCYVIKTGIHAGDMKNAMPKMVNLGLRLVKNEKIGSANAEGYVARGILKNEVMEHSGAKRGLDMLMAKVKGEEFTTELKVPEYEAVAPALPVKDIKHAKIAIISDGGVVPKGNPDNLKVSQNTVWAKYDLNEIFQGQFQIAHSGYHHSEVKEDLNRLLPLDAMKKLLDEGEFSDIYPFLYSTSGNTTTVQGCRKIGAEIAQDLLNAGITAAILTST